MSLSWDYVRNNCPMQWLCENSCENLDHLAQPNLPPSASQRTESRIMVSFVSFCFEVHAMRKSVVVPKAAMGSSFQYFLLCNTDELLLKNTNTMTAFQKKKKHTHSVITRRKFWWMFSLNIIFYVSYEEYLRSCAFLDFMKTTYRELQLSRPTRLSKLCRTIVVCDSPWSIRVLSLLTASRIAAKGNASCESRQTECPVLEIKTFCKETNALNSCGKILTSLE